MDTNTSTLEKEADHAETLIQGLQDTVNGVEGINLTEAQHYLHGVLYANGVGSLHVHGNEGVIDTIKAGLLKVWQVISDAFKKVWNYFFGNNNDKKVKKVIDDAETKIDKDAEEVEISENKRQQLKTYSDTLANQYGEFYEKHKEDFKDSSSIDVLISTTLVEGIRRQLINLSEDTEKARTRGNVKFVNKCVVAIMKNVEKMNADIKSGMKDTQKEIDDVHNLIKKVTDPEEKEKLNKQLAGLKATLAYIKAAVKLEDDTATTMQKLVDNMLEICDVKKE